MGERDKTPNHKEIIVNSIQQVLCASEKVDLRGEMKLKFGVREFFGQRQFGPVDTRRGSAVLAQAPKRHVWLVLAKPLVVGMWQVKGWRSPGVLRRKT
jgi:hypothetical protein